MFLVVLSPNNVENVWGWLSPTLEPVFPTGFSFSVPELCSSWQVEKLKGNCYFFTSLASMSSCWFCHKMWDQDRWRHEIIHLKYEGHNFFFRFLPPPCENTSDLIEKQRKKKRCGAYLYPLYSLPLCSVITINCVLKSRQRSFHIVRHEGTKPVRTLQWGTLVLWCRSRLSPARC